MASWIKERGYETSIVVILLEGQTTGKNVVKNWASLQASQKTGIILYENAIDIVQNGFGKRWLYASLYIWPCMWKQGNAAIYVISKSYKYKHFVDSSFSQQQN